MYTREDLQFLRTLVGQTAVAISNANAIKKVEEKERELDRHREMALIGTFATEMAHELNKPLTHIMNEGSRLEQTVRGSSRKSLQVIGREVQRASEMLDGFSMLSPGRKLQCIPYAIKDLLEEALVTLGLDDSPAFQIERQYQEMSPVLINPGLMTQVFTNVIQNAEHAMPDGGMLTLSLRQETSEAGRWVVVAISDTGRGIPPEIQPKVFDPFFTTKGDQGGQGMGLTISRAMVERHGGKIVIQSPLSAGGGTRLIIRIPILIQEKPNEK